MDRQAFQMLKLLHKRLFQVKANVKVCLHTRIKTKHGPSELTKVTSMAKRARLVS